MTTRRGLIKALFLSSAVTALAFSSPAKSCLWKVTSTNGTLYLQGSVHILKADNYPLAPAIEKAYDACDAVVLETDIKKMSSPEMQSLIRASATLPEGQSIRQLLDAETFEKLEKACAESGIPSALVEGLKPWYASMLLAMVQMQGMGCDPDYGLDKYFHTKAAADGKKLIALETVEFQIALFESLAKEDPNEFVSRALTDLKTLKADFDSVEKAWTTGDIDALGKLLFKSFEGYPDSYKRFVTSRNATWLKTIETLMKEPDTHMVVVGAGHLPGKEGLFELLAKQGYTLEQL